MAVAFGYLELIAPCDRCRSPVPVNRVATTATCSHCFGVTTVPEAVWSRAVQGFAAELPKLGEGGTIPATPTEGETSPVEVRRGLERPACPRCAAKQLLATSATTAQCRACRAAVALEPPPPWLRAIDAQIVATYAAPVEAPPTKAVAVPCPSCTAPLEVDGAHRAVPCAFCKVTVAVPEAIWAIFHPPSVLRRFHLLYDLPTLEPTTEGLWAPLGYAGILVGSLTFLFGTTLGWLILPALGELLDGEATTSTWIGFALFSLYASLVLITLFVGFLSSLKVRRIRLRGSEVVGRVHVVTPGAIVVVAEVRLGPPGRPGEILKTVENEKIPTRELARLGGDGARLKAWLLPKPGGAPAHVLYREPSRLED